MNDWLYCLLISVGSSTDNLSVGLSMGLSSSSSSDLYRNQKHKTFVLSRQIHVNGIISICNAFGAFLSSSIGNGIIMIGGDSGSGEGDYSYMGTVAPFLASLAFFYLAYDEIGTAHTKTSSSNHSQEKNDSISIDSNDYTVWKLAIPMTLNNLAGGVAGGSAGISPIRNGIAALLASFIMMQIGWTLGNKLKKKMVSQNSTHPSKRQSKKNKGHIQIMGQQWNIFRTEFISTSIFTILGIIQLFESYSNFFYKK